MPKWLKALTDAIGFWQTWFTIFTVGIPTVWSVISTVISGLPAHDIILYTSATFFLFSAGAVCAVHMGEWALEKTNDGRTCKQLKELKTRGHTDMKIYDLADLWSGTDQFSGMSNWVHWNSKLRDLKDAASNGLLIVSATSSHGTINKDAKVTIESVIEFLSARRR